MKIYLFTLLTFLSTLLIAQGDKIMQGNTYEYLARLANVNANNLPVMGFDNRYEGVRGTAFLWEDWQTGQILLQGKEDYTKEIDLNLDVVNQKLFFRLDNGKGGSLPTGDIQAVRLGPADTPEALFVVYQRGEIENNQKEDPVFYQVLFEGKQTLLKFNDKYLQKANYKGAYTPNVRYDEFISRDSYWLQTGDESYTKVKLNRKSLEKALPKKANRIKQLWKKQGLENNDEAGVVRLIKMLEE